MACGYRVPCMDQVWGCTLQSYAVAGRLCPCTPCPLPLRAWHPVATCHTLTCLCATTLLPSPALPPMQQSTLWPPPPAPLPVCLSVNKALGCTCAVGIIDRQTHSRKCHGFIILEYSRCLFTMYNIPKVGNIIH